MRPGEACLGCHDGKRLPAFIAAGTVYATGHEPNDCNGSSAAASVVITDATGMSFTIVVNSVGNFVLYEPLTMPYTASVQTATGTRVMMTPQTNGNCNSCHTEKGANGAPGRIVLP
jgi:hypothetical protein